MDISETNLSFAGCGFMCIYHFGVCAAIQKYAPHLARNKISGASAGSIIATAVACNVSLSNAVEIILNVASKARAGCLKALSPNFDLQGLLRAGLEKCLPADAHLRCTGKLFISLTRAKDFKNVLVSKFNSREEVIQAVICSCFIPGYMGTELPELGGEVYLDGGFTDDHPTISGNTIKISPYSGRSDICPADSDFKMFIGGDFCGTSVQFTSQNFYRLSVSLFPPSLEDCSRICRQGFEDALRFLAMKTITPCVKCLVDIQSHSKHDEKILNDGVHSHSDTKAEYATININENETICKNCLKKMDKEEAYLIFNIPMPSSIRTALDLAVAAENRLLNAIETIINGTNRLIVKLIKQDASPQELRPVKIAKDFFKKCVKAAATVDNTDKSIQEVLEDFNP
uniref:PNPLA domain-containing protein n=1 Tax=Ditylenchus dipsaci TaxID=166011 RepID=A0A915D5U8_9BILA